MALKLSTYRDFLPAQTETVSFITVEAVDANGATCPLADAAVTVALNGAGELAGFGNADPRNVDGVQSMAQHLWRGKASAHSAVQWNPGNVDRPRLRPSPYP